MKEELDDLLEAKFMLQSLVELVMSFEKDYWAIFNEATIHKWIEKNESEFIRLFKLPLQYCYGYKYTDGDLRPKLVTLAAKDDETLETVITPLKSLPDGYTDFVGGYFFGRNPTEVKRHDGSFEFFKILSYCLNPTMSTRFIVSDEHKCCFMDKLWKIDPSLRGLAEKC